MGSNSVLTTLIQDAILKLCTQNVLFDASLEIDGIICISPGQESKEIVVKMHRTIMKPTPEPEVFQPEPSPKSTHRRNRNQQAHSSNIESDTFPAQTSNISFDEMPKHDTYQDESGGATAYFPDEQQQYDTTPSKQSRKRRQPQTPTDTSSEEKYIKVEPGEGEILVEEPTNMPAAGESNDSYSDTSQGQYHLNQIEEIGNVKIKTEPGLEVETVDKIGYMGHNLDPFSQEGAAKYAWTLNDGGSPKHDEPYSFKKMFTCQWCNSSFRQNHSLKAHTCAKIKGQKTLSCSFCGQIFRSDSALTKHEKTYCRIKYPLLYCKYCKKRFRGNAALKEHENETCIFRFIELKSELELNENKVKQENE